MAYPFSGSGYGRVRKCTPSAVLARVRHDSDRGSDKVGTAIHQHLCDRARGGISYAMERLPAVCVQWKLSAKETGIVHARCRSFEWSPPRGAVAEIGLCMLRGGRVVRCKGGHGQYDVPDDALVPLTFDVMWSEPEPLIARYCSDCTGGYLEHAPCGVQGCDHEEVCRSCDGSNMGPPVCPDGSTLFVADYKTGRDANVEPIETNAQLELASLLAARWTGAQLVMPAVIFVRRGEGQWDVPQYSYDADKLNDIERELLGVLQSIEVQRGLLAQGEPLALREGPQCTYCEAQWRCPAKTALIKSVFGSEPVPFGEAPLDEEQRVKAAHALPILEATAKKLRVLLRKDVDGRGDIPLGDGNVWGPYEKEQRVLDPKVGTEALVEVLLEDIKKTLMLAEEETAEDGEARALAEAKDLAMQALSITLSGDAIEEVVGVCHERHGIKSKKADSVRRVFGVMGSNGGIGKKTEIWYGPHKPAPPKPPELEEQLAASIAGGTHE